MKNDREITTIATLLSIGLLSLSEGTGFDKTTRQLHQFLRVHGEEGATLLRRQLNEGIFAVLRDTILDWDDCQENHNLHYVLPKYGLLKEVWLEDAYSVAEPYLSDSVAILQNVEAMAEAKSDEELEDLLKAVSHLVLREGCVLAGDCVGFTEHYLTQWMVKVLKANLDKLKLSVVTQRALDLCDLLWDNPVANDLALISSYHGKFVPIAPQGVHQLTGEDSEDFLDGELSRLADTLPVHDFATVLSQLLASAPAENAVLNEWRDYFMSLKI